VSLKIILTVKRVFKHFSDTTQIRRWGGLSTLALLLGNWLGSAAGMRQTEWAIGKASLATRDATGHVSRLACTCMLVSCSQHPAAISRDGLTSLRVPFTSSCSRQLRLSPYCIPVLAATGVVLRQQQFVCCNIRVYRIPKVVASSAHSGTSLGHPKKLPAPPKLYYIHPPIPKRPGPDE
jgi:hypothetical protein